MDYELKKTKRDKSSIVPIEETYTDLDIKENDPYEPSVGFRFDTPRRWAQDKSKSKSIGIRDLKLTPSSGDIRCRFLAYAHIGYTTRHYVWKDTVAATATTEEIPAHYEKDGDDTFRDFNLNTSGSGDPIPLKFRAVSNAVDYSITPANNFEEIITDIMSQINGAIWKGVLTGRYKIATMGNRQPQKRGPFYVKETTETVEGESTTTTTQLAHVLNFNFLKLPITFQYLYDSNTCDFEIKKINNIRTIRMANTSKSLSETDICFTHWEQSDIPQAYRTYSIVDIENDKETQRTNESTPITQLDAYNPTPTIRGVELLMVVDTYDVSSLKAIYHFFNQRLSDKDIDNIALVEIDGIDYYVPFVKDIGDAPKLFNFVNQKGQTFGSAFGMYSSNKYNNVKPLTDTVGFNTNLNLNNVWDRIHLIYHATFAETRARIIGRNGDHWDSPNKRFIVPGGDQDEFYLRFTTDGKHCILPIGCHFNVDLCFMLNTTNNTATGNHDMFK